MECLNRKIRVKIHTLSSFARLSNYSCSKYFVVKECLD